jgi:CRP-like cAMP-binding protein
MSQHDLAAWAGLSREAVVKGMQTLRRLGWIETTGRDVVILDLVALERRSAT